MCVIDVNYMYQVDSDTITYMGPNGKKLDIPAAELRQAAIAFILAGTRDEEVVKFSEGDFSFHTIDRLTHLFKLAPEDSEEVVKYFTFLKSISEYNFWV